MIMEIQKTEEEVERGIRDSMQKRNITATQNHLEYLRNQKVKKRDASKGRVVEAEMEIRVIDRMLGAVVTDNA